MTRFDHDALDRVVRTVDALGNASESDFDAAGRTVATRDAAGNETSFVFDSRDRVVEVHGPDGAVTSFEYDAAGRRTAMVDPVGRRTEYEHDLLGRVIVQRRFLDGAPLETLSEFDAQGNRTAVTDEAGRITRFRYDLLGRLTETEDPAGGVTRRDYDADSNMVRYVNAKGSAWEFDYDALSRVVAERDPLGHETLFLYDLNSNLVWKRDPKGQETVLAYDALNRLTRVDYADGQWAAFSFDENGNRTEIEGSDGQRVAQTFDELDRVRTITHSALHRQLSYEYTATGARSAFETRDLTNGFVERTSYEWDQAGRPVAIRPPTGDVVTYHYAPDGAREGATLPNGVDVGYQYDSLGRLVEMTYRDTDAREIAFFRYQYDTAGNRTSQVDTEGLTQYTYGALDRLVEAVYPDGSYEKFTWDQVGNRLTHEDADGITSYAYDQGDRLLATTGAKPSSFTWDHNGNMLSRTDPEGTVAYRWNARDRLVRVDLPDGASNLYRYLPESDLRFSVTDKTGAETRFLWDGSNVVEELGPTNGRLAAYIEGLGVDEHLGRVGADGAVHAYVADPLGTVRAVVDSSGQIQNAYAYKAFGDTRAAVEGLTQPYRFTGRAFEPDTGEYYYRARYYQPGLGRFGAVDRYAPGEETFGYARGNPVAWRDPFGLKIRRGTDPLGIYDEALRFIRLTDTGTRVLSDLEKLPFWVEVNLHDEARFEVGEIAGREFKRPLAGEAFTDEHGDIIDSASEWARWIRSGFTMDCPIDNGSDAAVPIRAFLRSRLLSTDYKKHLKPEAFAASNIVHEGLHVLNPPWDESGRLIDDYQTLTHPSITAAGYQVYDELYKHYDPGLPRIDQEDHVMFRTGMVESRFAPPTVIDAARWYRQFSPPFR